MASVSGQWAVHLVAPQEAVFLTPEGRWAETIARAAWFDTDVEANSAAEAANPPDRFVVQRYTAAGPGVFL
jgi:hypothetical protein